MPLTVWEAEIEHLQGARFGVHAPMIATPQISPRFESHQTQVAVSVEATLSRDAFAKLPELIAGVDTGTVAPWKETLDTTTAIIDSLEAVDAGAEFDRAVMRTFNRNAQVVEDLEDVRVLRGMRF